MIKVSVTVICPPLMFRHPGGAIAAAAKEMGYELILDVKQFPQKPEFSEASNLVGTDALYMQPLDSSENFKKISDSVQRYCRINNIPFFPLTSQHPDDWKTTILMSLPQITANKTHLVAA